MGYVNLYKWAWWLVIIGGLNWLLVGLFNNDIIGMLGLGMTIGRIVYVLVGVSTLYVLLGKKRM